MESQGQCSNCQRYYLRLNEERHFWLLSFLFVLCMRVCMLSCIQLFGIPSPGKNTVVGCHFLLQGIFLTQGSNPRFLHLLRWQVDSLLVVLVGSSLIPLVPPVADPTGSQWLEGLESLGKVIALNTQQNMERKDKPVPSTGVNLKLSKQYVEKRSQTPVSHCVQIVTQIWSKVYVSKLKPQTS